MQPLLHPTLFHSNSQDARCTPVGLSLVSSTRGRFIFTYTPNSLSSFRCSCAFFSLAVLESGYFLDHQSCMSYSVFVILLQTFIFRALILLSFYLSPLSLSIYFFIARLSFPPFVPAFSHFSWHAPPSHSLSSLSTVGFGQLPWSPIG